MTDEQRLIEKLRKIEALFARPGTQGEREAARAASDRVQKRLEELRDQQPVEFRFSPPDGWSRALLLALLRRHSIQPYRYPGQRKNTVMARAPKRVIDTEIWPTFLELNKTLRAYLDEITQRVIAEAVHRDVSDPEVRAEPLGLPERRAVDVE
jgi:hypothetical protein